jgi:hypothetical protein
LPKRNPRLKLANAFSVIADCQFPIDNFRLTIDHDNRQSHEPRYGTG